MRRLLIAAAVMGVFVAGCGGSGGDVTGSTPARGRVESSGLELFEERVIGVNPGCVTCHSLEPGITLVGPSLFGIESRVPELTAAEYIRQSIVTPDAFIVAGFNAGQMSAGWTEYLTEDQIESLVDLLTSRPE